MIDDPRRDKLVMVMEYVGGGTLDDRYLSGGPMLEGDLLPDITGMLGKARNFFIFIMPF